MNLLRIVVITLFTLILFSITWFFVTEILTIFYSNYEVLENGDKGYSMNLSNITNAFIIALSITLITVVFFVRNRMLNINKSRKRKK